MATEPLKRPSLQFYPGDWLKDPALGMCSLATRGVWIEMLCLMHENGRSGVLAGTVEQLARTCRATPKEMAEALNELNSTGTADVVERSEARHNSPPVSRKCPDLSPRSPAIVTVINRRMSREQNAREYERLKKRRQRSPDESPGPVPDLSPSLSSSSSSSSPSGRGSGGSVMSQEINTPTAGPRNANAASADYPEEFMRLWERYPRRAGDNPKRRAARAWQARRRQGVDPGAMLAGVERYAAFVSAEGKAGTEYVMQAATFLGPDERYADPWDPPRGNGNGRGRYETPHERIHRLNADPRPAGGETLDGVATTVDPPE